MRRALRSMMIAAVLGASISAAGITAIALADPPRSGSAPDPKAVASRQQWIFEMTARGGKITVDRVKGVTFDKPAETPRVVGRFALELYIGRELLDRVRFNVPLMGGEASQGNRNGLPRPRFEENVSSRVSARMADNPRAAYLLLVDRETGDTQKLAWPPEPGGKLVPWTSGLSDAGPHDFPERHVRAAERRDGGAPESSADGGAHPTHPPANRDF